MSFSLKGDRIKNPLTVSEVELLCTEHVLQCLLKSLAVLPYEIKIRVLIVKKFCEHLFLAIDTLFKRIISFWLTQILTFDLSYIFRSSTVELMCLDRKWYVGDIGMG